MIFLLKLVRSGFSFKTIPLMESLRSFFVAVASISADLDNINHNHIIGRAWGESTDQNTKKITAAVGFHFSLPPLKDKFAAIKSLESTLDQLKSEQETMIKNLDSKLKEQDKQIEALLKKLK